MTLPPRCGQDAVLLQQTQDQHWSRQKKSHHYRRESVFGLAHYCYIMAHVNVYITLMWQTAYILHTTYILPPVPLCGRSPIIHVLLLLLKHAEVVWIIGTSVWAMTYAQSFIDYCQRLPHGVSNSRNHLVLSWMLSTSTKSTPSPDRLLSFDTFWLPTNIASGAGLVISLMLGFRSIASIFSANTCSGVAPFGSIGTSCMRVHVRSLNGGTRWLPGDSIYTAYIVCPCS